MKSRLLILSFSLVAILVMLGWFSLSQLSSARNARDEAAEHLHSMRGMAEEIRYLRGLSSVAYVAGEQPKQAIQPWLDCAKRAGLEKQLTDFSGSRLTPIPDSDYSQEQVYIRLEKVTCQQVFQFISDAAELQSEYVPVSLELQALPLTSKDASEIWTANLILTRLVFTSLNRAR